MERRGVDETPDNAQTNGAPRLESQTSVVIRGWKAEGIVRCIAVGNPTGA
jgi:hypothetical protein